MTASEAADELIVEARARPWGLAVAALDGADTAVRIDEGDDPIDESTHNGGTGGFRTFAAFHRPTRTAVALLANSNSADVVDKAGFKILTAIARSKTRP